MKHRIGNIYILEEERRTRVAAMVFDLCKSGAAEVGGWKYPKTVAIAKRAVARGLVRSSRTVESSTSTPSQGDLL